MSKLKYKSIDLTSITKFSLRKQFSSSEIELIIRNLAKLKPTHIAIAVPMDEEIKGSTPLSPREYTQLWIDTIRDYGMDVLHKPNCCGLEGLYGYEKNTGSARTMPFVWIKIMEKYILDNPTFFEDGDLWAPFPVMTEGIHYTEDTSWLPWRDGVSTQYAEFYLNVSSASKKAFDQIERTVELNMTPHPAIESADFIKQEVFDNAQIASIETFGVDTSITKLQSILDEVIKARKLPLFLTWGDKWSKLLKEEFRLNYQENVYSLLNMYIESEKIIGLNIYCEEPGKHGSLLKENYQLNVYGELLGRVFSEDKIEPEFENHIYYPEGEVVQDIPINMRGLLGTLTIMTPLDKDLVIYDNEKEIAFFNKKSVPNTYTLMVPFKTRLVVNRKGKRGAFRILAIQDYSN